MPNSLFPLEIEAIVRTSFLDPEHPVYGQLATVNSEGQPEVRTVHFHLIEARGGIAFNAHVRSPKWTELRKTAFASGCYFDLVRFCQIRFSGTSTLLEEEAPQDEAFRNEMWGKMRADVRSSYWLDEQGKSLTDPLPKGVDIDRRPRNLGTAIVTPTAWDIYRVHPEDYRKGSRSVYRLKNGRWIEHPSSLLR